MLSGRWGWDGSQIQERLKLRLNLALWLVPIHSVVMVFKSKLLPDKATMAQI